LIYWETRASAAVEVFVSSSSLSRLYSLGVLSAALSLFGLGCATGSDEVRHGIGAGYWEANIPSLPSRQSPIEAMAFGRGGSSQPASDMGVDAALAALDSRSPQRDVTAASHAKLVAARTAAPVQTKSEQIAQQPVQAAVDSNATVEQPVLLAANTQESRYASREAQSGDQQKFAGGDAIVITSGAIVLVLLIVLLVLLLR
jgi:cobalamin biosynthesis Mg chelatase CobN